MALKIIVCKDSDEMAERGAREVVALAGESVKERGVFNIALAGGSTPEKMYAHLVSDEMAPSIDWSKTRVFFGDERFVPRTDENQSNFAMAQRSLLSSGKVDPKNVFAFDTSLPTVQASALAYDRLLTKQLGEPPVFDLFLLGMGDDGHTASLFPHAGSLDIMTRYVVDTPPGVLPPPVDRMTITVPVLQSARSVLLLIGGEKKAKALHDVLEGGATAFEHPVASVLQCSGTVTFLLDEAAAGMLSGAVEISE